MNEKQIHKSSAEIWEMNRLKWDRRRARWDAWKKEQAEKKAAK
jgi:hypothetical protein